MTISSYMKERGEQFDKKKDIEERLSDFDDYQKGLDLVFGLLPVSNQEEREEIKSQANNAAENRIGLSEGEDVFVNESLVQEIERRLGKERMNQYLSIYKDELRERFMQSTVSVPEGIQKLRDQAREGLFVLKKVRKITF